MEDNPHCYFKGKDPRSYSVGTILIVIGILMAIIAFGSISWQLMEAQAEIQHLQKICGK